jgi:hypothetical protein
VAPLIKSFVGGPGGGFSKESPCPPEAKKIGKIFLLKRLSFFSIYGI